ncbi:MAG TPA: ATP-binding cassette domain-containing protein [Mobilitalea sp.]|nr:ATP-binding cassette domain-containing protein [Mobilitalea sp.]
MDILQIKDLNFTYPDCGNKILDHVSFNIRSGDFVVVCGETGCGKSTLLRMLKKELIPVGERTGSIYYNNILLDDLKDEISACEIGFVMQKPENQIVTDKVWHELSFGLENMGLPSTVIRRRVSEMSSYFGIGDWFNKEVSELSGGQKQLLNLASIMVMQPKVLILDEPTSQLDPIAAVDFIATLQKLNRELSLTILLVEHRLEEVFPIADRVLILEKGKVVNYNTPVKVAGMLRKNERMMYAMPSAVRLFHKFDMNTKCPITVKEGRSFIDENFTKEIKELQRKQPIIPKEIVLQFKDVWFRYHKDAQDILKGTTFSVFQNEIYCILGGNASGKTTMLGVAAGIYRSYSGTIKLFGQKISSFKNGTLYKNNLALLPQDAATVFVGNTLEEDLYEMSNDNISFPFEINGLLKKHPYDLSGGEQQLCALAKVLLQKPRILLLDEPTKGIDAIAKQGIIKILNNLKRMGLTIIIVTHDVEFAASCADRCALFFDGDIVSSDVPELFFAENNFYTTAANRMTRYLYEKIVTIEDAIDICSINRKL